MKAFTSYVWDFFELKIGEEENKRAYCLIGDCTTSYAFQKSTTNMRGHLLEKHRIDEAKAKEIKEDPEMNSALLLKSNKKMVDIHKFFHSKILPKAQKEEIDNTLVKFFVGCKLPINLIKSSFFLDFCFAM